MIKIPKGICLVLWLCSSVTVENTFGSDGNLNQNSGFILYLPAKTPSS